MHLHAQSRLTLPRASTPPATRTGAPATRASCSVMPAGRLRSRCRRRILLCGMDSQGDVGCAGRRRAKPEALGPDAKSQVTIRYENGKPVEATQIVVSTQHFDEKLSSHDIQAIVEPYVREALPPGWVDKHTIWHVNPTGKFVIGGPDGDTGLTGRKIIVDTYGGAAPHGGGAFSGKDPTKVDRSAAYAARYLAKNVVAAELADRCAIQIAYAIGIAKPLALYVDFYGTGKVAEARLEKALDEVMDLTPRGIREHLGLNRPIYARTSAYGHFGRAPEPDGGFSWERTDLVDPASRSAALGCDFARDLPEKSPTVG